jgi:conjugative relaxase-like TrwC/TraI family protein
MISAKAQKNLVNAKEYFKEHLSVGDYYTADQKVAGQWQGKAAETLGLRGAVKEEDFVQMCEGKHPQTGEKLTLRRNESRQQNGKEVANRRVFYDFMFAPPKSVSLVALTTDSRLIEVHETAVAKAFVELEKYARTRVRKKGLNEDRPTGNVAAAFFRHDTSRAQDPQLHTHAIVFNATQDPVESKWKALEVEDMYQARNLVDAVYNAALCKGAVELGYQIERKGKSFELAGVPRALVEKFSKRRLSIDETARAMLQEMKGEERDLPRLRDWVAHEHRNRKMKDGTPEQMATRWLGEMTEAEKKSLRELKSEIKSGSAPAGFRTAAEAVALAQKLVFERNSVVEKREIEHTALMQTWGTGVSLEEVRAEIEKTTLVQEENTNRVTSLETLRSERDVIAFARDNRDRFAALNPSFDARKAGLDGEQAEAVEKICRSRDGVTLFRGAAGTGKTHTLKVVCESVRASGKPLLVIAPQGAQARDMAREGMAAQTVARFLQLEKLPEGAVVLIDEGGQVSTNAMGLIMQKVAAAKGRLIISGDTRQHGAVEASDALIALEKHTGLIAAEIKTVRRQNPGLAKTETERVRISEYRSAVESASAGKIQESYQKLNALGALTEVKAGGLVGSTAAAYLVAKAEGAQVLAVTQTRALAIDVNAAIGAQLEKTGEVLQAEDMECLLVRDLLKAEKNDARSYAVGDEIIFNGNYGTHKKGEVGRVLEVKLDGVVLAPRKGERMSKFIGFKNADRWSVVERQTLRIGRGTKLQMKANLRSREGRKTVNGEIVTVQNIRQDGALVVVDEKGEYKTIEASQRLLNLGYCVTSYASQGKTVDTVILADAGSAMATHQKEWYVSITRARKNITVFSEDLAGLGERIVTDKTRSLGVELKAKGRQRAPRRAGTELLSSAMAAGLKRAVAQMAHVQVFTRRLARTSRLRTNQFIKTLWKSHNRI